MTNLKRFFFHASVLLAVVIFVSELLFLTIFETKNFPLRIMSTALIWLATCSFYFWVMKTVAENPKAFIRVFMLQTFVKLLLYIVCVMLYLLQYRQHGIPFAVHFMVVYLVFAVFEILKILKFVNNKTGQTSGNVK